MTGTERAILETLIALDTAARTARASGSKPDLLPLFARLDELTAALPSNTAPDLLHYLHRKSYDKARRWLEGRGAENPGGTCPH